MRWLIAAFVPLGLLVAGCGVAAEEVVDETGDEAPLPVTTVVTEHLPTAPDHAEEAEGAESDVAAASIRYGPADTWTSENLRLHVYAVDPSQVDEEVACDDGPVDGCEKSTLSDGSTLYLSWQLEEPEEDPGIIWMAVVRDDAVVGMTVTGPTITGHPADLDLGHDVDLSILKEILADPRLTPESPATS